MIDTDRTVHGEFEAYGTTYLIVRYDRAGKWYAEPAAQPEGKRWRMTVSVAASNAAFGKWYPKKPGGSAFDRKVSQFRTLMESADE